MKTSEFINRPSHLKSLPADPANKAGIQLIRSLYLRLLNLFLIKKTVQFRGGVFSSTALASLRAACVSSFEEEEGYTPDPGHAPLGSSGLSRFLRWAPALGDKRGLVSQHPGVSEGEGGREVK